MKKITKTTSTIHINHLELSVNLGWRKSERENEQSVLLDMDITFLKSPKACVTDKLDDTVCYADLIADIRKKIGKKNYRLIEHLSADIYQIAKASLPKQTKLMVHATKFPQIDGLIGGVCFSYGDE